MPSDSTLKVSAYETAFFLTAAYLLTKLTPFKTIQRLLGKPGKAAVDVAPQQGRLVQLIGHSIDGMAGVLPWKCYCVEKTLAARFMLRRRGLSSTAYFGAFHDGHRLKTHAWLDSGPITVVGGEEKNLFTPVICYGDGVSMVRKQP